MRLDHRGPAVFSFGISDAVFLGPDTYRYVQVLHTALAPLSSVRRAVDIGCGAGPGAITIAALLAQAEVWAVDINPNALELTSLNAQLAGTDNVRVAHSDLLHGLEGQFDLTVANPPFMLDASQRLYCHSGGEHGEGLSVDIVHNAMARLVPGGCLVVYACAAIINGVDIFRTRIAPLLETAGFEWIYREIDRDVFGGELGGAGHEHTDRIAAIALIATLKIAEQVRNSQN